MSLSLLTAADRGLAQRQPDFFPTLPGVEMRHALLENISLSPKQISTLEDLSKGLHQRMRAMQNEMGDKDLDDRRAKLKELFDGYARDIRSILTTDQQRVFDNNLVRWERDRKGVARIPQV